MVKSAETALLYAPQGSTKSQKMRVSLIRMGAKVKNVTKDMFSMTVAEILGLGEEELVGYQEGKKDITIKERMEHGENEKVDLTTLSQEVLVLYNFTSGRVDVMLNNFRKSGVGRVNLKAVVTQTNVFWTFEQLIGELIKEHEAFSD